MARRSSEPAVGWQGCPPTESSAETASARWVPELLLRRGRARSMGDSTRRSPPHGGSSTCRPGDGLLGDATTIHPAADASGERLSPPAPPGQLPASGTGSPTTPFTAPPPASGPP